MTVVCDSHRRTGWGVRGSWPPKIRADTTFIRAKDNTFVRLTVSPNGTSIHLREIRFGSGNKGDVHRVILYDRKKSALQLFIIIFSPWRGRMTHKLCSPFGPNLVWPPKWMFARMPMVIVVIHGDISQYKFVLPFRVCISLGGNNPAIIFLLWYLTIVNDSNRWQQ